MEANKISIKPYLTDMMKSLIKQEERLKKPNIENQENRIIVIEKLLDIHSKSGVPISIIFNAIGIMDQIADHHTEIGDHLRFGLESLNLSLSILESYKTDEIMEILCQEFKTIKSLYTLK